MIAIHYVGNVEMSNFILHQNMTCHTRPRAQERIIFNIIVSKLSYVHISTSFVDEEIRNRRLSVTSPASNNL